MSDKNYKKQVEEYGKSLDFEKNKYQLKLDTTAGSIVIDMYPDVAPGHVKNILGLANAGFYNGIVFHRVIKGFVIQAGCPAGVGTGGPGYTIDQEFNEKKHVAGTLSMARTNDPNSAGSQFFLCLGDVPNLDNQYTVFGQTADEDSTSIVMSIGGSQTDFRDKPVEDVMINEATIVAMAH